MENIKFEITEEDIRGYLKVHKDDKNFKYKEAMFMKYLKENNRFTSEALEMLIRKFSFNSVLVFNDKLPSFISYSNPIQNLDLSGICHILIPTMKYYGKSEFHANQLYTNLGMVSDTLVIPMENPLEVIESTLDDYRICGKVETNDMLINIKMSKESSRGELLAYQEIYDENKVKRIRKIIRERV